MNESKSIINNEIDYSNKLINVTNLTNLVSLCDNIYKQFINLINTDEEKNKQFKEEYKEYNFKKHWGSLFEINIRDKNFNSIKCDDINTFNSAVNDGNLKNCSSVVIELNLNFKRGKGLNLDEHENEFKISFKPYEIKLLRKSNHNDNDFNNIENALISELNKFPDGNSIFCDKS